MSLCISVVTPEGIVVAGESRQTQVVGGVNRVGSDSANKVFQLTDTVLAATAGWAFLLPNGVALARNISSLVEDFRPSLQPGSSVHEIATSLWQRFNTLYQEHVAQIPGSAVAAGQAALHFTVAGYDPGSARGVLYAVEIPSNSPPATPARATDNPGPWWIGQVDVIARIVKGYDVTILNSPVFSGNPQIRVMAEQELARFEYLIFYNTMTLQDAIDFVVGLVQVTITIQRFTAGTVQQPGSLAAVGGPIDVAVVRPGGTVSWVRQKELHT